MATICHDSNDMATVPMTWPLFAMIPMTWPLFQWHGHCSNYTELLRKSKKDRRLDQSAAGKARPPSMIRNGPETAGKGQK
eukprot:2040350-Pyramimonas_sp.AAC.1